VRHVGLAFQLADYDLLRPDVILPRDGRLLHTYWHYMLLPKSKLREVEIIERLHSWIH